MTALAVENILDWPTVDNDGEAQPRVEPTGCFNEQDLLARFRTQLFRPKAANENFTDTATDEPRLRATWTNSLADVNTASAEVLAEWSGYVTGIQPEALFFSASLKGVTGNGVKGEEDDAVIPVSDVSDWDRELLQLGSFFRLCVMHEITRSGQPRRYTQVIFRRLPAYRQVDLDKAQERGLELARRLRVD